MMCSYLATFIEISLVHCFTLKTGPIISLTRDGCVVILTCRYEIDVGLVRQYGLEAVSYVR